MNDGKLVTDESEVGNYFNEYFTRVGSNLAEGIISNNIDPLTYMGDRLPNSFFFHETNAEEVSKLIYSFKNKKCPIDSIPTFILKKVSGIISPILADLFNDSIKEGIFPEVLKLGRVIPLHKAGSHTQISNFRPITTLSVFSKLFEKLVHKRLLKFITKFSIINLNQFGFQKSKNTSDAILEFLDYAFESLNNNKFLASVFLDFSKAFDTISLEILLKKLHFMGFRGLIHSWIRSYLENRKQFVSIGISNSNVLGTTMGVPQGSTLGPILFILYINDMKNCLNSLNLIHFADDSTLYIDYNKNFDITSTINSDLNSIYTWLSANKLFLNVDKTKYLIVNNRDSPPNLPICIGNSFIERTDTHKFLGVHIDDRLNFRIHTRILSAKVSRAVGLIRKMKVIVPSDVLRNLHYCFVYSKFTYALPAFAHSYQNSVGRLSKNIDKSLKILTNQQTINLEVCSSHKLFNFELATKYFSCIKMYQIMKMHWHKYFYDKINSFQVIHAHETRSSDSEQLNAPLLRSSKCQRSFLFRSIKIWNEIPLFIRNSVKLTIFKSQLRNFLFCVNS